MLARRSRLLLCAVLAGLGSCGSEDQPAATATALGDDAITVGSFEFAESVLLAEIYSQALEGAGYRVQRAFALGPREFVDPALSGGLIELVPEYAGSALTFRSRGTVQPSADVAATHAALLDVLADTGVTALASARAQNTNTFVVTPETARRFDLDELSDLAAVATDLRFGGPPECELRPLCLAGLRQRYGLRFGQVITLDSGGVVTHQALRNGNVDVALLFTTDPELTGFVELADDRALQPAENVTPLVRRDVVDRWGRDVVDVIDGVSAGLDTDTLRALNAVDAEVPGSDDVATVAAGWLRAEGSS